jgi:hypothetical protein
MFNHGIIRWVVALGIGILLSLYVFERIADPEPAMQRVREEAVVLGARQILQHYVAPRGPLEIVDPLARNREAGKVYVYPDDGGWEVSGHYRRSARDPWHAFLMSLDQNIKLRSLSVNDANRGLAELASGDNRFSAVQ